MDAQKLLGVGVVVGRFQSPYLHEGHLAVLNAANHHEKLIIFVGVHRAPGSFGNELDFETRHLMLKEAYPNAMIFPIKDEQQDSYWSKKLDNMIECACPVGEVVIYHGRRGLGEAYHGKHRLHDVEDVTVASGTKLRKACYTQSINSFDFRRGVFYAMGNVWPRVNPCVDMAVMRKIDGEWHVALGNREADPSRWRFPGGHVDMNDESNEHAVRREVMEETGLEINGIEYICSRKINDWRDTKTNCIMTNFYWCDYMSGALKGDDDLHDAKWVPIHQLKDMAFAGEHDILVDMLLEYAKKHKNFNKKEKNND